MKTSNFILLIGICAIFFIGCSTDEYYHEEEQKELKQSDYLVRKNNETSQSGDDECMVVFIYRNKNISDKDKRKIRNYYHETHFLITAIKRINKFKEIWYVDCQDFEYFIEEEGEDITFYGGEFDNDSCKSGSCGTDDNTPDSPTDPFDI